jgi:hypothetical protein
LTERPNRRVGPRDRRLELLDLARQRLKHLRRVVERHDRRAIAGTKRTNETKRSLARDLQLVSHARARIDEQDQIEWNLARCKEGNVLLDPILVDGEVVRPQPGDVVLPGVRDGDVEGNQLGAALEDWLRFNRRGRRLRGGRAESARGDDDETNNGEASHAPLQDVAVGHPT